MTRLTVRLSLLIVCVGAIAAAAFFVWTSFRIQQTESAALRNVQVNARAAAGSIADLRAAQQSYVAAGQGADFWFTRVTEIRGGIDDRLSAIGASIAAPEAHSHLQAAATILQEFMQMDLRAREYTRDGQLALASDMIFSDGFDLAKKAGEALERAVTAEEVFRDAARGEITRRQALAVAGSGAVLLLTVALLLPVARRGKEEAAAVAPPAAPPVAHRAIAPVTSTVVKTVVRNSPPAVDLDRVASLCADLARVHDTRGVPALLERAATVLGASGIVLWIADPDGRELAPILVHGYPPNLAMRLGTIARAAENVTASAYRTGLLQVVKGDAVSTGAIAVPLVGAGGTLGVMAAEMKDGGEQKDALLSAAVIIAAQLATLVGPPAARAKTEAAG